ncbi:hypothetical protein J3R82DRAFT_10973 [Butyriboletus roseoflavus]|nr:hypothetical protein J3R82DRAFT_10973 [Butyriboletus roseoflavus]
MLKHTLTRKRKMRCDGAKPACQQCVRAKKIDGCQYDDGKGKTRTQLLRENIERLERRIRELEDPEYTSPSVTLHDPHFHRRSESSSSSLTGSPGSTGLSAPHSPLPPSATSSPQHSWIQCAPSPSPTPFSEAFHVEQQPTVDLALMLLDIFSSHRHQCLLGLHMGRLRDSLTRPATEQHHPCLTNAIFLWACYISRPGPLSEHESHYLNRSLEGLSEALQYNNRVLDVIQASCLLSVYFLSNGRALEGSYHAAAAASLTLQCGLHGAIMNRSVFESTGVMAPLKLDPAKDAVEQGERILTFWQVFVLDRCWSAVLQKPATMPDGPEGCLSIVMPWPQGMEEYESGQINDFHSFSTTRTFFDGQLSNLGGGFSPLALKIKASSLFHHAHHLASNWDQPLSLSNAFMDDFQTLEHTIARFLSTLMPIHQLDPTMPDDKHAYIAIHTLAHVAIIHLYYPFGHEDPAAYEKCLQAARCCVSIIKHLAEADYNFLDPILGPCWTSAMDTLIRELNLVETSWPIVSSAEVRNEIGTLLYAMTSLGDVEPSTLSDPRIPSPASLPVQPSRPTYERRSLSCSTNNRTSSINTLPRTSVSTRLSTGSLSSSVRQWSLFGQLMENEGQLRGSGAVPPESRQTSLDRQSRRPWALSIVQSPVEELSSDVSFAQFPTPVADPPQAGSVQDAYSEQQSATDEEVSSEGSEEMTTTATRVSRTAITRWIPARVPTIPLLWKNMLKCSVAYFIGSLFTFHPSLSRFFGDLTSYGSGGGGPYPSAHLIATIAVYYNPAKTIGGMFEADSFCMVAWLYSALMSLSGLSLFWWLDVKPGLELLADFVLIIWVGLTIWGLTWMKVWMAKPTFNSACSMSATVLFVVMVREGTWETLLSVSSIVLMGTAISNLVCFSLWPQSATYNLQINMTKTLDSFSTLLGMITSSFLLEEPIRKPSHEKMQRAVEAHQSSFTSLKKSLAEARSEWFGILGEHERLLSKQAYGDAVDSLTRLAQHLNGLRSGTRLQYELSTAQRDGKIVIRRLSEEERDGHATPGLKGKTRYSLASHSDDLEEALLHAAAEMFGDLLDDVGPPLKALSNACTSCLKRLREAFVNTQNTEEYKMMQPQDFHKIMDGIDRALSTFASTSNDAVLRLYRRSNFASESTQQSTHSSLEDNNPILAESEHEHIFLVYFFIFTLQEFAGELMSLTDAMRRIYAVELARFSRQNWFRRYLINGPKSLLSYIRTLRERRRSEKAKGAGLRRISTYFNADERHPKVSFPKIRPHAPNTLQTPDRSNLTFVERFLRSLWDLGDQLRDRNINYAFKVGMSTALLACTCIF